MTFEDSCMIGTDLMVYHDVVDDHHRHHHHRHSILCCVDMMCNLEVTLRSRVQ
jgi:hypothetical protein